MPYAMRCCRLGQNAGPMSCVLQGMANPGQGLLTQVLQPPAKGGFVPHPKEGSLALGGNAQGKGQGTASPALQIQVHTTSSSLTGSGLGQRFCALVSLR